MLVSDREIELFAEINNLLWAIYDSKIEYNSEKRTVMILKLDECQEELNKIKLS